MEKIIKELEEKKSELLKEVETIDKAIKTLSKKDISPAEKWVLETIDGVKPTKLSSGNVDWCKDGEWLFNQDFTYGRIDVSFCSIWKVLRDEFGLSNNENQELLTNLLYDYTDNGKLKITW